MHSPQTQNDNKTLIISGCTFSGNSVGVVDEGSWGGAVVAAGGTINVTSTVFTSNLGENSHQNAILRLKKRAVHSHCIFSIPSVHAKP